MTFRSVADQVLGWRKQSSSKMDSKVTHHRHPEEKKSKRKQPPPPPNPEQQLNGIGCFSFVSPLGDGKFSKVFLARHYMTDELFAIKVIDKRLHEYRVMSRLVREIKLMEALNHPNVVRLHETIESADSLYLVMEYVPGRNLDEHLKLRGGSLDENEARMIFRQMVLSIAYCHERWVVHRDLKAPNVLLTPDGTVKLADFGLGNRFGLQRLKTVCGSMLYYSPEIISGKKYYGPEVDCWCLGVSLFRMTAGFEPFAHAKTVGELKEGVTKGEYPMPPTLSEELQNTIRKCLTTRWRSRRTVQHALRGDPWLNDHGRLPDVFSSYPDTADLGLDSNLDDTQRESIERACMRRKCQRDLEEEKLCGTRVHKTVVYHPFNTSIYFTSPVEYSTDNETYARSISSARDNLYRSVRKTIDQLQIQPTQHLSLSDVKSPIHHLFRRLTFQPPPSPGQTKLSRSLSQLYQRVAKDQVHYYSIHNQGRITSSATAVSGISSSMSTSSVNFNRLSTVLPSQVDTEQHQTDAYELIDVVRSVCEVLGITYRHDNRSQLTCVLTLRNFTETKRRHSDHDSAMALPQDGSTSAHTGQYQAAKKSRNSMGSSMLKSLSSSMMDSSNNSHRSSTWFGRQIKRLSLPLNSNQTFSHPYPTWPPEEEERAPPDSCTLADQDGQDNGADGAAMLTIHAFPVPMVRVKGKDQNHQIVGLWFTKAKGSSKVFKLATGWIIHSLETNAHVVNHP